MSAIQARHETGEWRRGSSVAGEVNNLVSNVYTLHAATGEIGYLAWTGGCPGSEHLQWELWDATQTTRLYLAFGCHDIGRVVFPTAGQYVIVVSSPEGTTGKYQLEWRDR